MPTNPTKSLILRPDEVRGLLDGSRTMIARVMKEQPPENTDYIIADEDPDGEGSLCVSIFEGGEFDAGINPWRKSPFGPPGTRLICKETFWTKNDTCDHEYCSRCDMGSMLSLGEDYAEVQYCATPECCNPPSCTGNETVGAHPENCSHGYWWLPPPDDWNGESDYHGLGQWEFLPSRYFTKHSPATMPPWASRLTLVTEEVKAVRVQEVTWSDAIETGIDEWHRELSGIKASVEQVRGRFLAQWDKDNPRNPYDANCWVWLAKVRREQ